MAIDLNTVIMLLYRYIVTSALIFGAIGSIFNIIVFLRKNLRRCPCSLYYLTQSVICLLLLYTTVLLRYLAEAYLIDLPSQSSYTCKLFLYTSSTFRCLSAFFVLWSSIDRYLASSSLEKLRNLSKIKYAIYTIILTIGTISIVFIYIPIYFSRSSTLALTCSPNGHGTLTLVHNLFVASILAVFVPLMVIVFSILTFQNIQRRKQLVHTTNTVAQQRQNFHMIRLMLSQSSIYLTLVVPSAIFNLYTVFISLQTNAQLLFAYKLLFLFQYVYPATPFYINTLVSYTYRQEVIKVLDTVVKRVFHSAVVERHLVKTECRPETQTQNKNLRSSVTQRKKQSIGQVIRAVETEN